MLLIACGALFPDPVLPADRAEVAESLTGNFRSGTVNIRRYGEPMVAVRATVQPVRFDLQPGFEVSAALWTPDVPSDVGILVAHGHYGQGKSGAEAQEIATQLAAAGAYVLAVDTPGVEEWDVPGRQIHFEAGAHNRGILASRGTSAMALQIDILRRGVDVLAELGAKRIGATGASGGAVQAFYLGWLDDRVQTAVMASAPPIPREAAASGCACDHIPGHPGPDPALLGQWTVPTLWLSDVVQARPEGLPSSAVFEVLEGPHSFTTPMQVRALGWFSEHLGLEGATLVADAPHFDLSTGTPTGSPLPISSLAAAGAERWDPEPTLGRAPRVSCEGAGPVVLTLGSVDGAVLREAGWSTCALSMPMPPGQRYSAAAWTESIGAGTVLVDELAGAVALAVRQHSVKAIWAHRGWGLVASALALPYVVHQPITELDHLKASDPPWIHVPGAWEGVLETQIASAAARSDDVAELLLAFEHIRTTAGALEGGG